MAALPTPPCHLHLHPLQVAVELARDQEVQVQARSLSAPRGAQVCHLLLHLVRKALSPGLATWPGWSPGMKSPSPMVVSEMKQ